MDVNAIGKLIERLAAFRKEAQAIQSALGDELPEGRNALETRMLGEINHHLDTVGPALRRRLKSR